MTFPRHFPFSCRVCTHGRQSFFFLSPTGRMMAVSVPARPPTVCLSIPSSSSQIRSVKSPVGCRYNKIYCSLSLSPPHVGVWVGRSVGRSSPGNPADPRSSAEWRVDGAVGRSECRPCRKVCWKPCDDFFSWNLGRFTFSDLQGCQMAQLDSSCPLPQPAEDDLDKSTQGKATARWSVAQFCQPPCVHLFCAVWKPLLTMRARHDRHTCMRRHLPHLTCLAPSFSLSCLSRCPRPSSLVPLGGAPQRTDLFMT